MKAILPVAGAGTRLRPLTHTVPKVLVHVAGKPILGHILDSLIPLGVDEIILVVGQFGDKVVDYVKSEYNLKVHTVVQASRRGNGHAVFLTKDLIGDEPCLIVFGDTLFKGDLAKVFTDGTTSIGVRRVENPRAFGVVETEGQFVTGLVEKPENPTTDLAIVGVYYIQDSRLLFRCLEEQMEMDLKVKGEYQLTSALELMIKAGHKMTVFPIDEWYDCGNPEALLAANRRMLEINGGDSYEGQAIIIPPVAIGEGVTIENSVVGPYVSIAHGVVVKDSIIRNSIINGGAQVESILLSDSLVGENAVVSGTFNKLNIGDSSTITGVS